MHNQITTLEAQLYLHIFMPEQDKMELTEDGRILIEAFRDALALHNGSD